MPIPARPGLAYRYHVHDYAASAAFTASPAMGLATNNARIFYSLTADLTQLVVEAGNKGIAAALVNLGNSDGGRPIHCLTLGGNTNKRIALTGGIHAREWIAVEIPYLVAEYLIRNYHANPINARQREIKSLVDDREIWFVPMINPDGHNHTVTQNRMWRSNRRQLTAAADFTFARGWTRNLGVAPPHPMTYNAPQHGSGAANLGPTRPVQILSNQVFTGVDCNRNFPHPNWGVETYNETWIANHGWPASAATINLLRTTTTDPSTPITYCGPAAGSEPETQAVMGMFDNQQFMASIDFHNYSQLIIYPDEAREDTFARWLGCCMEKLIHTDTRTALRQAAGQTRRMGRWRDGQPVVPHYRFIPVSELYPAFGSVMHYSYQSGPRPAYTIELDPTGNNPGFELPDTQIQTVFEKNIRGVLALIKCAARDPRTSTRSAARGARQIGFAIRKPNNCCSTFNNWDVFGSGNALP